MDLNRDSDIACESETADFTLHTTAEYGVCYWPVINSRHSHASTRVFIRGLQEQWPAVVAVSVDAV